MAEPTIAAGHVIGDSGVDTTSYVIDAPGHAEGDIIYIAVAQGGAAAQSASGFDTLYGDVGINSAATFSLFYKTAGASEPATYTVTTDVSDRGVWIAWAVNNQDPFGVDTQAENSSGTGTTATVNALETAGADRLGISIVAAVNIATPFGAMSNHDMLDEVSAASGATIGMFYQSIPTATTTPADSATLGASTQWIGVRFSLAPGPGVDLSEVIDEAVDVDEDAQRQANLFRRIAEGMTLLETLLRPRTMARLATDTVDIGESPTRFMVMSRQIAETINVTEAIRRSRSLARAIDETVGITEAVNRAATWIRTISETVNVNEAIRRVRGTSQVISETVDIAEATAGILGAAAKFLRATFRGMYRGMFKRMG